MNADVDALRARIVALEAENRLLRLAHRTDMELLNAASAEMEETMRLLRVLRAAGLAPLRVAGSALN